MFCFGFVCFAEMFEEATRPQGNTTSGPESRRDNGNGDCSGFGAKEAAGRSAKRKHGPHGPRRGKKRSVASEGRLLGVSCLL